MAYALADTFCPRIESHVVSPRPVPSFPTVVQLLLLPSHCAKPLIRTPLLAEKRPPANNFVPAYSRAYTLPLKLHPPICRHEYCRVEGSIAVVAVLEGVIDGVALIELVIEGVSEIDRVAVFEGVIDGAGVFAGVIDGVGMFEGLSHSDHFAARDMTVVGEVPNFCVNWPPAMRSPDPSSSRRARTWPSNSAPRLTRVLQVEVKESHLQRIKCTHGNEWLQ